MKKGFAGIAAVMVSSMIAASVCSCGGSQDAKKVGEVTTAAGSETTAAAETAGAEETTAAAEETKSEYHVGDILKDGDVQIVYAASGEYTEDNEFMQPADGNKLIFMKFAFENQGSSDASVSSYSFECYADGYSCEEHYTDDDLSATLSAGRTTEGIVAFEVPENAQAIEVEYETNMFTDEKIKFIYDGDKDSGYVAEGNSEASADAFSVGDIVESDTLNITYISCENDTSYDEYFAPEEGYHYETLTFEFENTGNSDEYVSSFYFDCYADGQSCESAYFRDDELDATLSAGRKAQGTVTFTVPDSAVTVEAEFVADYWTSSRVVFTVGQ